MNCRPGQLAMYVGLAEEHRGKIVLVLQDGTAEAHRKGLPGHWWAIEPALPAAFSKGDLARDDVLRPLRGSEGVDEMLRITGKPVTA